MKSLIVLFVILILAQTYSWLKRGENEGFESSRPEEVPTQGTSSGWGPSASIAGPSIAGPSIAGPSASGMGTGAGMGMSPTVRGTGTNGLGLGMGVANIDSSIYSALANTPTAPLAILSKNSDMKSGVYIGGGLRDHDIRDAGGNWLKLSEQTKKNTEALANEINKDRATLNAQANLGKKANDMGKLQAQITELLGLSDAAAQIKVDPN